MPGSDAVQLTELETLMERLSARLTREDAGARSTILRRLEDLICPFAEGLIDPLEFVRRLQFVSSQIARREHATSVSERASVAWHEAGHAVIAHVLKCEVREVSLEGTGVNLTMGRVGFRARSDAPSELHCIVTLAGPCAQVMALGPDRTAGMFESHRRECNQWLHDGSPGMSTAVRLAYLQAYEIEAQELVSRYWPSITRVFTALLFAGTLTREAFLEALAEHSHPLEVPAA